MKLVVGLGNPGNKYKDTRHNVGFWILNQLGEDRQWQSSKSSGALVGWLAIDEEKIELMKPQKFMNKSGLAVAAARKKHPKLELKDVYVVHDDLDIKVGEFKITFGKGPKVHNGLQSIYEQLGTKDFWHVRIGIDNRAKTSFKGSGEDYVLGRWLPEEKEMVEKAMIDVIDDLINNYLN